MADLMKRVLPTKGFLQTDPNTGKEYPKVEAWTSVGQLLALSPVARWTRKLEHGWESAVVFVIATGVVIALIGHFLCK